MKKILVIIFVLIRVNTIAQNETAIFDSNGEAKYYIENSSNIIYSYEGNPVAYISLSSTKDYNIYSFNGQHLGWFENGIMRDHNGNITGFEKDRVAVITKIEPLKQMKKIVPMKHVEVLPPPKPVFYSRFSISTTNFFFDHDNENKIIPTPYNTPDYYTSNNNSNFVPTPLYHPPFEAIEKNLEVAGENYNKQQAETNKLLEQGYIYDPASKSYFPPDEWVVVKKARETTLEIIIKQHEKTPYYLNNKKIKDGKYMVCFITPSDVYPIPYFGKVEIRNNKLVFMEYSGRKRKFKEATKIQNGMCTARVYDKFGWGQNSILYPVSKFYIFDLKKNN